jgi:UDP-N-acetyl-D-glucosamine dehydrogenase
VDPYYLAWKAREFDFHTKFIQLAAETNLEMPFFAAARVRRMLTKQGVNGSAKILVLGATFKPDIDDARNSAALRVVEILRSDGARVEYHDPFVPQVSVSADLFSPDPRVTLESVPLTVGRVVASDCVVILVRHSSVDYRMVLEHSRLVFDAVNATRGLTGKALVERL